MKLKLQILTSEKEIFNNDVDEVIVPTTAGVVGILPQHMPLVSQIAPGEVIIKNNDHEDMIALFGGFMEVNNNNVSILADYAARVEDIELAKAEQAKERAEKLMQEKLSEKDFILAESELQKALMQLRIANKYRKRR